jgi:hypothetical protein
MSQTDIADMILYRLYVAKFSAEESANLFELRDTEGWDKTAFSKIEGRLTANGLIKGWTAGGNYLITPEGVISAEEQGIPPKELVKTNQRLRTLALDTLAKAYEEKGMLNCHVSIEQLMEVTGAEQDTLFRNLSLLTDLGYAEIPFYGHFKITYTGIDAVEEWRQKVALADEFERVEEMEPHPRGQEFQKLFAEVVEKYGWSQEEGIHTSHEEMDVVICQGREYYLIECKWEKDPIEAGVIRELYGKLGNRVGVQGIAVSMSGFSEGAVKQVNDYKNERIILLFGPGDVHSMIFERIPFDELLNQKFGALVTRGRVVFS